MDPSAGGGALPRAVLLEGSGAPALAEGEAEHLTRVLRLGAGAEFVGLDGRGGLHPLRIERVEKRTLVLARAGEPCCEPAPGDAGAELPWIEIAVAWPRAARAEEMLDMLAQLGVASVQPLDCRQSGPQGLPDGGHRRERALRVLREACKQCRRAWFPELAAPCELASWIARVGTRPWAVLDPDAPRRLVDWLEPHARAAAGGASWPQRLAFAIGPEGGFDARELADCAAAGAARVRLAPHVLRIETAAVAAAAAAVAVLTRARA